MSHFLIGVGNEFAGASMQARKEEPTFVVGTTTARLPACLSRALSARFTEG